MRNCPSNRPKNQLQTILVRHPAFRAVRWHGIMLVVFLLFLPLYNASASTGQVGDRDMTLNCEFTRYGNSGAATKLTKGWIPPHQTHHITGDEVVFESYYKKLKGKVTKRDDERIEWKYQERAKDYKGGVSVPRAIIPISSRPRKSPAKWGSKSIAILNMSGGLAHQDRIMPVLCQRRINPQNPSKNRNLHQQSNQPKNGHICAAMVTFQSIIMRNSTSTWSRR